MEETTCLKPSISGSRIGDRASVQAATRVNAEQASKATMRMPTLLPFGEGCMSGEAIDISTRSIRRGSGRGTPERWFVVIGGDPLLARVAASTLPWAAAMAGVGQGRRSVEAG
jgi:hypothetical protein